MMRDQREQQNQHGGKADQHRAAVGRSRANSSRIRNEVKPAGNRKSWIKSGATWRNRARSPAPANRAPKILPTWKVLTSAPKTGLLFGQRLLRPSTATGSQFSALAQGRVPIL